jgi:hypothetical protein
MKKIIAKIYLSCYIYLSISCMEILTAHDFVKSMKVSGVVIE